MTLQTCLIPAFLPFAELYDGAGQHLGGIHPPLLSDNVLTQAFHASKAMRPVSALLHLTPDEANADLGLVWMVPLNTTRETPVAEEIIGHLVQALDARRAVMLHGDNADTVAGIKVLLGLFAGGGHA